MTPQKSLVSIFTRLPVPSESKTRLIPALGPVAAAKLQREMTQHVLRQARIYAALEPVAVEAYIAGGSLRDARRWLRAACIAQGEGDLGQLLERAFLRGSSRASVTTVVGGDCPAVSASDLSQAAKAASLHGAAIIPAFDGGFCALSLRSDIASQAGGMLGGVEWGSERACEQTVARLRDRCATVAELPARADVDRPEDLPAWETIRRAWYEPPTSLTVVIPTLDEAATLPTLLAMLATEPSVNVIVVDGGSTDATPAIASRYGATLVSSAPGRGVQMNVGAAVSQADALIFLHADTLPPQGFARTVLETLSQPDITVGAFSFATDTVSPSLRLVGAGTRMRGSLLSMPYGDQGIFCRKVAFEALGGFPQTPVMEDYEFVRRARRAGRVRVVPQRAVTSSRRWLENGVWRWTALNVATVAKYRLGTSPEHLDQWRRAHSKP